MRYSVALLIAALMLPSVSFAQEAPKPSEPTTKPNAAGGSSVNGTSSLEEATELPDAAGPPAVRTGPLAKEGEWLNDHGLYPRLTALEIGLGNPSAGQRTGYGELVSLVGVGLDVNLGDLTGYSPLHGTLFHFQELFVPRLVNQSYGVQAGDVIVGQPGPYIPWSNHLVTFTLEQRFFNEKFFIEGGRSNAGAYVGLPVCNQFFACVSNTTILQQEAGFAPPPYSNWSARAGYDVTKEIRVQIGAWGVDPDYPFTNGWAWWTSKRQSSVVVGDAAYRSSFFTAKFPSSFEAMFFHNNTQQVDPYYTASGSSRFLNPTAAARTINGTSGFYLAGNQTVWRADGGKTNNPFPTSVAVFGALAADLDRSVTLGVQNTVDAGVILQSPFPKRPFDSFSVRGTWSELTSSKQKQIEEGQSLVAHQPYSIGRSEYALQLDANVAVVPNVFFSPYVLYAWNPPAWFGPAPFTARTPSNGFAVGFTLVALLDNMLGLNKPGGYRYP